MAVKIPFLGDGIDSANVISILVSEGDTVEKEETLIELETDKATAPVPSTVTGKIIKLHIKEGDIVRQGMLVADVEGEADESVQKNVQETPISAPIIPSPSTIPVPSIQPISIGSYTFQSPTGAHPPAAPSIRKLAAQISLDLTRIVGSGNGGRITWDDLRNHIMHLQAIAFQPQSEPEKPKAGPKKQIDFSKWGPVTIQKTSSLRQKISSHLHHAWETIPHVTQFDEADITDLMKIRKQYNPTFKEKKTNLTMTVFALKAVVAALKEFPLFNSSYNETTGELHLKEYFHIGVAVDTENGLIVPVIRDVDKKDILSLSLELTELAEKARKRELSVENLQGGCFTISNLGGLGVGGFTPIVNHPEVAILGLGKGKKRPEFINNELEARMLMPVSVSYDHRVIDGADGARFVRQVIGQLEAFDEGWLKEIDS